MRIGQEQVKKIVLSNDSEDEDDYDAEDLDDNNDSENRGQRLTMYPVLERTQSVIHLPVDKPGLVRLENVRDTIADNAARILSDQIFVVRCPKAEFVGETPSVADMKCVNSEEQFLIRVFGMPPLSLRWRREINGRKEFFNVEGIDGVKKVSRHMPLSIA